MRVGPILAILPWLLPASSAAQNYFPHHNFTFGAGAGRPRGDLGPALQDAPGISAGYGYRFHRYFQADLGLDILFGAAQVRDFLVTGIGDFRIGDREYFLPFGGRAIIPLADGRLLLSGGAGGTWIDYRERVSQPSTYFRVDCPVCTSRDGWGYYALGNASWFLNRNQNFRVGMTTKVVRGYTNGQAVGPVPGLRTNDKWLFLNAELGFSF
jgi:hypothetical protein